MFNGVPEQQFHQFITSRTTALPLPLPLTLPVHVSPLPPNFSIHELHQPPPPHHQLFQQHLLHPLQRHPPPPPPPPPPTHEVEQKEDDEEEEEEEEEERVVGRELELDGMRSTSEVMDPWLKEEVLALLTIRSSIGNEFSDFIWGHVSRKLAELGYKRTAEKCKEKFEEVSKYCSNNSYGNYYRSFNELEALFQGQNHKSVSGDKMVRPNEEDKTTGMNVEENSANETLENPMQENQQVMMRRPRRKKRKNHQKLQMFKDFAGFVNNVLVQQEELQKKFLEDVEKIEAERVAKEEAWRMQEMDRKNKELDMRAKEQAIACERQLIIIDLLNKASARCPPTNQGNNEAPNTPNNGNSPNSPSSFAYTPKSSNVPPSATIVIAPLNQVPLPTQDTPQMSNSSTLNKSTQNPNLHTPQNNSDYTHLSNPSFTSNERDDHGKRWPRDEVNSLINLRCNLQNTGEDAKVPLWERISQGMLELGYKRSAKKCKEKWENINKYFRKTKDANKKRSLDSKTCPYFHQLNTLYNQGRLIAPSEAPENQPHSPKTHSESTETAAGGSSEPGLSEAIEHMDEGEKNMTRVNPLEFEY